MKNRMFGLLIPLLTGLMMSACTLSTTGLRPPSDHSLIYGEPEPETVAEPAPAAPVCQPPSLMGTPGDFRGCKAGDKLVLSGLSFAVNSAELGIQAKNLLGLVAAALKAAPDISVEIAGHTDNTGAAEYNLALSAKRVASVRNYLSVKGVASSRMSVKGYGEAVPIAENSDASGRASNRRVELVVSDPAGVAATAEVVQPQMAVESATVAGPDAMQTAVVPAPPGGSEVSVIDNAFVPEVLTVKAGTTVTWTNAGGSNHKIKFSDTTSSRLRTGAKYSRTMEKPGSYDYECGIHGSRMSGKIIVE